VHLRSTNAFEFTIETEGDGQPLVLQHGFTDSPEKLLIYDRYGETRSRKPYAPDPHRRRAKLASPPAWIKPQLAKLVDKAPDGSDARRIGLVRWYPLEVHVDGNLNP
jgi:hypothetical protein